MSSKLVSTSKNAKYLVQVTLTFKPKRANVLGDIQLWDKMGGSVASVQRSVPLCPAQGCFGAFVDDDFELTADEANTMDDAFDRGDPHTWPESAKLRYDTWLTTPVACPRCLVLAPRADREDTWGFNTSLDKVAQNVEMFFRELDSDADIFAVIERHTAGLNKARADFQLDKNSRKYMDRANVARERHQVFYRCANLLRDASNGSSVQARILAMLKA